MEFCINPVPIRHKRRIVCFSGYKENKPDIPASFRRMKVHFFPSLLKKYPVGSCFVTVSKSTVYLTKIPLSTGAESHVPDPFQVLRLDGPGQVDHRITVIRSRTCAVQTDENIKLLSDFLLDLEMYALVSIL